MEIRHIMHTARSATIEIADGGRYFTKQPVELRVNGEPSLTTEKTTISSVPENTTKTVNLS